MLGVASEVFNEAFVRAFPLVLSHKPGARSWQHRHQSPAATWQQSSRLRTDANLCRHLMSSVEEQLVRMNLVWQHFNEEKLLPEGTLSHQSLSH